ncbi:MAG: HAMP domain-containing histidine kinase [Verrucomicrobiae bacterium]|nr:HAMP domain-containing histidine kinase [Verrucomicrobiae bacterium]
MSEASDSAIRGQALNAMGVLVLSRQEHGEFVEIDPVPAWWKTVFGSAAEFRGRSPFLEDFAEGAAAEFWDSADEGEGTLPSGIWEETTGETVSGRYFFEAIAGRGSGGESFLMVMPADDRWQREQGFTQNAHDQSLGKRRLVKELEKKQILLQCIMHDLGNPLSTVLMNLQHIGRQLDDHDKVLRPAVRRAVVQAERQRELIRSIAQVFAADLVGASHSGDPGAEISVNLMSVAAETIAACAQAAAERGVTLCPFFSGRLFVVGEPLPLSRILENLLINAIRHSSQGGQVTIAFEEEERFAICRIEDGGPGIDESVIDRLFQPFSQGGDMPGQSGLGLYFCRMTIEMWGGSIVGSNRPEGGACFEFRLPLAISANASGKSNGEAETSS